MLVFHKVSLDVRSSHRIFSSSHWIFTWILHFHKVPLEFHKASLDVCSSPYSFISSHFMFVAVHTGSEVVTRCLQVST